RWNLEGCVPRWPGIAECDGAAREARGNQSGEVVSLPGWSKADCLLQPIASVKEIEHIGGVGDGDDSQPRHVGQTEERARARWRPRRVEQGSRQLNAGWRSFHQEAIVSVGRQNVPSDT